MGAVKNHFHDEICGQVAFRDYLIGRASFSPAAAFDWEWRHADYDGAPDGNDRRCGRGASVADCIEQIVDLEDDA